MTESFQASPLDLLTGDLSSQLPSSQQVAVTYLEAIVAFWIIGGITLYAVNQLSKGK